MSPRLSQLINSIIPSSHIRDLVVGEILREHIKPVSADGLIYAHSLTSLYASHILADGHSRIHFFPCTPTIQYTAENAHFSRISPNELKRALSLISRVKPSIRSVAGIGHLNTGNARWWSNYFDLKVNERIYVKNVWAFSPRQIEALLNSDSKRKFINKPATLLIDVSKKRQAPIAQIFKVLKRVHAQLYVIAIIDNDSELETLRALLPDIDQLDVQIIDRRHYKKSKRYKYLLQGLFRNRKLLNKNSKPRKANTTELLTDEDDDLLIPSLQNYIPKTESGAKFKRKPLLEQLQHFSANIVKLTENSTYDMVLSFDIISSPGGYAISKRDKCQHIIDFNETPIFEHRIGKMFKSLSSIELRQLYDTCYKATTNSKLSIAPSFQLGKRATEKYGVKSVPIRSLHGEIDLIDIPGPREEFSISKDNIVLIHCCTYAEKYGSDLLMQVMAKLPEKYHLIMVGNADSAEYDYVFKKQVKKLQLDKRIHFKPNIDGVQNYLSYMSKGDLGVIMLDNQIATVRDGLANRFVDLLGAGIPIVSTHAYESTQIINSKKIGDVVYGLDPVKFASSVNRFTSEKLHKAELKTRVLKARAELSWDKEMNRLFTLVKQTKNKRACFVFQRGLVRNKRILRLATEFTNRGWSVDSFSGSRPPDNVQELYPAINFYRVPANRPWHKGEYDREEQYVQSLSYDQNN